MAITLLASQRWQRHVRRSLVATLLALAAVLLAGSALGFVVAVSPQLRPSRGGQAAASAYGRATQAEVAGPTGAILAAGGLLVAAAAASGRRSASLLGRAATEKENWSLDYVSKQNDKKVKEIRELCGDLVPADWDDVKLLRFAMQHESASDAAENVKEVLVWRAGEGAKICAAAKEAIAKATAGGGWDNTPVFQAAPHSDRISKHITPEQMVVVSTKVGDLVTCIRASSIDSEQLMKEVTEEEMTEFFIYAREINSAIAETRTRATGHVSRLISANDLTGVSKFPDQAFQNALTGSAKRAVTLYPGYSGPTILLNLPWLARMLVSILTPLFPGAVREKIKFARGPMAYMENLKDILKEPTRSMFVDDLQAVMNS